MPTPARQMDRLYRLQRHLYDATRYFFLPGRDRLIRRLPADPGDLVLEVGCGTARNLRLLAARCPGARLYGLDVSEQMLQTARRKIGRDSHRIELVWGDAGEFDFRRTFHLDRPFDIIFFSYSLSMVPDPVAALRVAVGNLSPAGSIHLVDFWDLADWPRTARALFIRWLNVFHVRHVPGLIDELHALSRTGRFTLDLESIAGRYAILARLRAKTPGSGGD